MAFWAVRPHRMISEALGQVCDDLRAQGCAGEWVDPRDHHVTLVFLGGVPRGSLVDVLEQVPVGFFARWKPFALRVKGLRVFALNRHCVIWAALERPDPFLDDIHRALSHVFLSRLSPSERSRALVPHITLCRTRARPEDLLQCILPWSERDFGCFEVNSVELMSRTRVSDGAACSLYQTFGSFPLGTGSNR